MKPEIIRVAKKHRPLTVEAMVMELKKHFPDYQCIYNGPPDKMVMVKKSPYAGARIDLVDHNIHVVGQVPGTLAKVLNLGSLGAVSAAGVPKLVAGLKRFLRDRYAV